jgi:hypothetical protein
MVILESGRPLINKEGEGPSQNLLSSAYHVFLKIDIVQ